VLCLCLCVCHIQALYCSKICSYAQGMNLIMGASEHFGWNIDPAECARIWKGGCIIRAGFLDRCGRAHTPTHDPHVLVELFVSIGGCIAECSCRRYFLPAR
jgi:6-phosphogluconate dehydrogenase